MFEHTLQVAARLLSAKNSSALPVRTLWEYVSQESRKAGFDMCTLPDFAALLEADVRFEFIRSKRIDDEDEDLSESPADEDLARLGFFSESTVCLRRKVRPVADDDVDEMPSISTRHLSETRSVTPRASTGRESRSPKGKTVPSKSSKTGGKRRSR